MKKIKTTDIVAGVAYPPSKKGLDFLQQSYQEILGSLAQTFAGNTPSTTVGYVLYGVVETDLGSNNYSYTAGAIYFNGEVYPVDAQASINLATGKALNITVTNDPTADPTTFTDGSSKNVHNVRKLTFANSATGDLLYGNLVFIQTVKTKVISIGSWNMDSTDSVSISHGLTLSKIRTVSSSIVQDGGASHHPFLPMTAGLLMFGGGTMAWDGTVVTLRRFTDAESTSFFGVVSKFDNAGFDDTSINRGWITITYVE